MIRLLIVVAIVIVILFVLRSRATSERGISKNFYRNLIFITIVCAIIFFLATSGKLIIPQLLNIIKIGLPFLTKFIGI